MELTEVGRRVPLEDAYEKVTGQLKYSVDINPQGMLYSKILRSPCTHAKIVGIDISKAESMPGVEAVITHKDMSPDEWLEGSLNYLGPVMDDRVRFIGDEVAAVAAINEEIVPVIVSGTKPSAFTITQFSSLFVRHLSFPRTFMYSLIILLY